MDALALSAMSPALLPEERHVEFRSAITFVRPALVCRCGGAPTRCSHVWDNTPAAVSISLPSLPLLDSAGRLSVGDRLDLEPPGSKQALVVCIPRGDAREMD
jgi:hypothetical protein